jgi:hypothetical protein
MRRLGMSPAVAKLTPGGLRNYPAVCQAPIASFATHAPRVESCALGHCRPRRRLSTAAPDGITAVPVAPGSLRPVPGHLRRRLRARWRTLAQGGRRRSGALSRLRCPRIGLRPGALPRVPRQGDAPLEVFFHDESMGYPITWAWAFGDGTSSTEQHPTHTYGREGSFSVALTVTNDVGSNTLTRPDWIVVGEHPGLSTRVQNGPTWTGFDHRKRTHLRQPPSVPGTLGLCDRDHSDKESGGCYRWVTSTLSDDCTMCKSGVFGGSVANWGTPGTRSAGPSPGSTMASTRCEHRAISR